MAELFDNKNFPPLKNDRVLKAARGEAVDRVPVWVMRQAGRYLPEFRKIKEDNNADFFKMVQTPEICCELTLQPINKFDLDAAIIFSDILVIPQLLGMTVEMLPGKGPHFPQPLEKPEDIEKLKTNPNVQEDLSYVYKAITLTRHKLEGRVPLFGFTGAPWTLMSYMIEGGGSTNFTKARRWLYEHIEASGKLLQMLTDSIVEYLILQVKAGAQILQVFESHGGLLGYDTFMLYSLPYLKQIAQRVKERLGPDAVPMVVFARGAHYAVRDLSQTDYDVVSLDWLMSPTDARILAPTQTLQGNLDPAALYGSHEEIESMTKQMIRKFGIQRYIANLGHGMHPDHDPEKLRTFIDTVHSCSIEMRERQKSISDSH